MCDNGWKVVWRVFRSRTSIFRPGAGKFVYEPSTTFALLQKDETMPANQIVITVPENVPIPAGVEDNQDLLRGAVAVTLYKKGVLSMKQARDFMGLSRRGFEEVLPEYGYTMMDEKDFQTEVDSIEKF